MSSTVECVKVALKHNLNFCAVTMTTKITGIYISLWSGIHCDISLLLGIYYDISLTTDLYVKYIPVDSFNLRF